jgi:hypothetical protein
MPNVGDVAAIPLRGGYGACQVTGLGPTACALDWFSTDRPELDRLASCLPLVLDHHALRGQPTEVNIVGDEPPPPWWIWLGQLDLPPGLSKRAGDHAEWGWLATQIAAQRRWDHDLPPAARQAYHAGAGKATTLLDLTADGSALSDLDQLPRCTSLAWSGPDRGLRAALTAHPIVSDLTWVEPPPAVDLTGTYLTRLRLSGGHVRSLRLPPGIATLKLDDDAPVAAVAADDDGRWLRLVADHARLPRGLTGLRDLELTGDGTISVAGLADLRDLRRLRLTWRSAPGRLTDATALATVSGLADIRLTGAYGMTDRTLPELPSLRWLACEGLYRRAAAAIETRYRDADVRLDISDVEAEWREY